MNQQPIIWIFKGDKYGDFLQMENVAKALGFNYFIKELPLNYYKPISLFKNNGIKQKISLNMKLLTKILIPPWPDLVLASGKHGAVAAMIVKTLSLKTKLVHIGRPWCNISNFDLIITTPQYGLADAHNVILNPLTLNIINPKKIDEDIIKWRRSIPFEGPYLTVLLGGNSKPLIFTKKNAIELSSMINKIAYGLGYKVLISSSRRTPVEIVDLLIKNLQVPFYLHRWQEKTQNPYFCFLGLADLIICTNDSASMISEICSLKKEVLIYSLENGYFLLNHIQKILHRTYNNLKDKNQIVKRFLFFYQHLLNLGIYQLRDMDFFIDNLKEKGLIKIIRQQSLQDIIDNKKIALKQNNFDNYFNASISKIKNLLTNSE